MLEELLTQYDYALPPRAIAQEPASPRDSAKLLVYDRTSDTVTYDTYLHLDQYLPKGALLVFNDTRVIPARLYGTLTTGGKVEVLFTSDYARGEVKALLNKNLKPNTIITIYGQGESLTTKTLTVKERTGKEFTLIPSWPLIEHAHVLSCYGHTPIPPYIKHSPLTETELRAKYQTVFAKYDGSVAAPTASLHFTERLLKKLKTKKFEYTFVTLHVNLGTFAPLTEEHVESGTLHTEYYSVQPDAYKKIMGAKNAGRPIIAVGTTAARTLETIAAYMSQKPEEIFTVNRKYLSGSTNLFIKEGYTWKIVDGLITNFHVPRSSLMMLVAAFIDGRPSFAKATKGNEKLLELYKDALAHDFHFFSFGDGMLVR